MEHRSYVEHACSNADHKNRVVVVCNLCSMVIEKKRAEEEEEEEKILEDHVRSGNCDVTKKVIKPRCPVKSCKEILTFSMTYVCKTCRQKVCFKHRFPTDHMCAATTVGESKFLVALASRSGSGGTANCRWESKKVASPPPSTSIS